MVSSVDRLVGLGWFDWVGWVGWVRMIGLVGLGWCVGWVDRGS